jgi:hypothetical protein
MGAFLFSQSPDNGDLTCTYSFGTNWLFPEHNGTGTKLKRFEQNATIEYGDSIHTKEQSLCELKNKELHIRLGSNSILEVKDGELLITKGNILINNKSGSELSITSELSTLKTEGQFTAIIDCTSNGGFKFIPLEGKGKIIPEHGKTKDIYRGRLTMIIGSPSQLGSAYDIDLLLLLKSSRLINSFPTPLPSLKRISLSVYAQQLRMKGKYNALIGDAPTNDNLQMWAFGEDDAKK